MSKDVSAQIEALLFYHGEPIEKSTLADMLQVRPEIIQKAVASLKADLDQRGLTLTENESTVQLRTDPDQSDLIKQFRKNKINSDLTDAQAEALAVTAYLQPAAKPRIDFIRGVNSRTVLRNLKTRGLIKKTKKDGKKCFRLTSDALAHLGITSIQELPQYETTREKLAEFTTAARKQDNQTN